MGDIAADLAQHGYVVVRGLLGRSDRRAIEGHEKLPLPRHQRPWQKARGARDPFYADLVTRPAILDRLRPALGEDIILWGVDYLRRAPGRVHPWHSDVESCDPQGGFVSVWIALAGSSGKSTLNLIPGSHRYGRTLQEAAHRHGKARGEAEAAEVLDWAREHDPRAQVVKPKVRPGDAIFFDGRLWHGTENTQRRRTRHALLVQYARADRPVRISDGKHLGFPVRLKERPLPPVVAVAGRPNREVNRVVKLPKPVDTVMAPIQPGRRPHDQPFKPHPLFETRTANAQVECHYSVLAPGHSPHAPHAHAQEELLMVIDGAAEAVLASRRDDPEPRILPLVPGQFTYYPAGQFHTIRNASEADVTYLMLRWTDPRARFDPIWWRRKLSRRKPMGLRDFDIRDVLARPAEKPFHTARTFNFRTRWLRRLHAHVTRLRPGAGYKAHRDDHDVAIVLYDGTIQAVGKTLTAPGLAFFPAGSKHGMTNPADTEARYLVFEFHNLDA